MNTYHPGAAVTGLIFVALGAFFLLDALDVVLVPLGVVLPLLAIGLGMAVIITAILRSGGRSTREADAPDRD